MFDLDPYYIIDFIMLFCWLYFPYYNKSSRIRRLLISLAFTLIYAFDVLLLISDQPAIYEIVEIAAKTPSYFHHMITVLYRCSLHMLFLSCFYLLDRKCPFHESVLYAAILVVFREFSETLVYIQQYVVMDTIGIAELDVLIRACIFAISAFIGIYILHKTPADGYVKAACNSPHMTILAIGFAFFEVELVSIFIQNRDIVLGCLSFAAVFMFLHMLRQKTQLQDHDKDKYQSFFAADYMHNKLETINDFSSELSKTKHEMLHHFSTMNKLISENKYDELSAYITRTFEAMSGSSHYQTYSQNIYINSILHYYKNNSPEIQIRYKSVMHTETNSDSLDIGLTAFLLLDAYVAINHGSNDVFLEITQKDQFLYIYINRPDISFYPVFSESESAMLERVFYKHDGFLEHSIQFPYDTAVCLKIEPHKLK